MIGGKVEISAGSSILLYAVLAGIMHGLRPLFARGHWEVHCILSGVFTSLIVLAQYLMITFRRGSLFFTPEVWWQIAGPGLIAMAIAPIFFWGLQWLGRMTAYPYSPERGQVRMRKRRLSYRLRIQFLGLFMLLGVRRTRLRLWWVQVAHGAEWTAQIRGSSKPRSAFHRCAAKSKTAMALRLSKTAPVTRSIFTCRKWSRGYRERFGQAASDRVSSNH